MIFIVFMFIKIKSDIFFYYNLILFYLWVFDIEKKILFFLYRYILIKRK